MKRFPIKNPLKTKKISTGSGRKEKKKSKFFGRRITECLQITNIIA
jgi:hypothetical protein